jgi:nucleoside phosphorylase
VSPRTPSSRVVVVAAFEPELTAFREALPHVRAVPVGVGLVDAALGVAKLLSAGDLELVVLLGTCGVYRDEDLGGVLVARTTFLAEPAAALGHAALPEPITGRLALDETFGAEAELGDIATTLGITTSDEAAALLGACAARGVRCGIILGAANPVGARGREEWRRNNVAASAKAAAFAVRALAPGFPDES